MSSRVTVSAKRGVIGGYVPLDDVDDLVVVVAPGSEAAFATDQLCHRNLTM